MHTSIDSIMKPIKSTLFALVFVICASAASLQAELSEAWSEDYESSMKLAKEENKPVLLLFTGSDWCPPCQYMERNVYTTEAFEDFADEHLVLVKADFLRRTKQAPDVARQNSALAGEYGIEAFPTVFVLSPDGKILKKSVGANPNTPDAFIAMVEAAVKGT